MYIVRNSDTNETIAICSRKQDALALAHASKIDNIRYTITKGENECVK